MLRNLTLTAKAIICNNQTQYKNLTSSIGRTLPCRFMSNEIISTAEPQPDKLYKRIEIEVRGNDEEVLKSYGTFACEAAKHLDIIIQKHFKPAKPTHERFTLLKSKHIYKKHRVQYEMRTYYRFMHFINLTGSTADTFLEYIQRNLPEGVAMKVTKIELKPLPETVQAAA